MAHDENFDIAEEVARSLAMRSHDNAYVPQRYQDESISLVGNASFYNVTHPINENCTLSGISSSTNDSLYIQTSPTSTRKRGAVGRKPPKGPDGIRRYSSRRATFERRNRINMRERDRMHQLCDAFERLRQVLPCKRLKQGPHRQKPSKISTLLLAQNYIRALEMMLEDSPDEAPTSTTTALPDTNGVISSSPPNISQQTSGHAALYYFAETSSLETSSGTTQFPYESEQVNQSYSPEYYRMEPTTNYQY